jgi:hypothetical protein
VTAAGPVPPQRYNSAVPKPAPISDAERAELRRLYLAAPGGTWTASMRRPAMSSRADVTARPQSLKPRSFLALPFALVDGPLSGSGAG